VLYKFERDTNNVGMQVSRESSRPRTQQHEKIVRHPLVFPQQGGEWTMQGHTPSEAVQSDVTVRDHASDWQREQTVEGDQTLAQAVQAQAMQEGFQRPGTAISLSKPDSRRVSSRRSRSPPATSRATSKQAQIARSLQPLDAGRMSPWGAYANENESFTPLPPRSRS
jgi:hypothetical protein